MIQTVSSQSKGNLQLPLQGLAWRPLPGVDLVNGDVKASGNVLNGLVPFRDDANTLGNGLGSDWMVTSDHDDLCR